MQPYKAFNLRIDRELWVFLKKESTDRDQSMTKTINQLIAKLKEKKERKELTQSGANI